jgi:lysophospholipase L1-like esterase
VGLGDSLPGALNCSGCTSYVVLYGEAAATALGRKVDVTNLATNDSLESGQLVERIRSDKRHQDAIASADILTLQVGFNDWQGPCNWPNDDACFTRGSAGVEQNLAAILDEVSTLRDGKPTAIRVLTYYNMFLGDLISPTPPLADPAFQAYWAEHLKEFNAMLCGVARARGAICIDLVAAFNGPTGDAPAKELVGSDNVHPTQNGHQLIAATLDAAGYAPLG